jgi:hypothetical protein
MRGKLVWAGLFAALLLAAPAAAQGQASPVVWYGASLTGSGESPAVVSAAFGDLRLIVDTETAKAEFTLRLWNVPPGITGAHIHLGVAGANGPVIYNLNPPPGASGDLEVRGGFDLASNLSSQPTRGLVDVRDVLQILNAHPEMLYVNVHTTSNPGGEIRGQLGPYR